MRFAAVLLAVALSMLAAPVAGAQDFDKGSRAYKKGDYATALREWRPLAEQGNAAAQYNLGYMYNFGWGLPQNDAEAMKWYHKAAEQGFADAQFRLGAMYFGGERYVLISFRHFKDEKAMDRAGPGVPQDYGAAVKLYRKAAEQGQVEAQGQLGAMYQHGQGVPQDYVKAHAWYSILKGSKLPELIEFANVSLAMFVGQMTPAQITEAQRMAAEWLKAHPDK